MTDKKANDNGKQSRDMIVVKNLVKPKMEPNFFVPKYSCISGALNGSTPPREMPKMIIKAIISTSESSLIWEKMKRPMLLSAIEEAATYLLGKTSANQPKSRRAPKLTNGTAEATRPAVVLAMPTLRARAYRSTADACRFGRVL